MRALWIKLPAAPEFTHTIQAIGLLLSPATSAEPTLASRDSLRCPPPDILRRI